MNTAVSTVGNLLIPSIALANSQGVPQSPIDQTSTGLQTDSNQYPLGIPGAVPTTTTDNNLVADPKKTDKQQPQSFYLTFLEQIQTENIAVENNENSNGQIPPQESDEQAASAQQIPPAEQPFLVQTWNTQYAVPAEYNNGRITAKMMPQSGLQLAQSIADLNGRTLPPLAEETIPPAENQPKQITSAEEIINTDTVTPTDTVTAAETFPGTTTEQDNSAANLSVPIDTDDINVDSASLPADKTPPPVANSPALQTAAKPVPQVLGGDKTISAQNPQNTVESADSSVTDLNPGLPLIQPGPVITSNPPKPLTDKAAADNSGRQAEPFNELSPADNTPRQSNILAQTSTDDSAAQQGKTFKESANSNGQPQPNSLPDDSLWQKPNVVIYQNPPNQIKQESKPVADISSSGTNFAHILSADNPQTTSIHNAAPQQSANSAGNTPAENAWQNVGDQLFTQIQNSVQQNQQQITIRLNPPELGRVVIKFSQQDNQIIGLLEVSRPQTRYEIEQALPGLLKNLADSGIQVKNFDVFVKDQPQNDFYRDAFAQTGYNDRSSQQNFAEGSADSFNTAGEPLNTGIAGYQNTSVSQQAVITDNSINVLI